MDLRTLFFVALMWQPFAYAAADSKSLEGHYFLHGAMEMGAELLLRKDGTFSGGIAYGSADGIAKGSWHVEDNTVTLKTDAASRPPKELEFHARSRHSFSYLEPYLTYDKFYQPVRDNYVLQMVYSHYARSPEIEPVYAYFEFSQGASSQLLLSSTKSGEFWLPYDPQKTLKKIGFGTSRSSGPTKWYEVSPTTRALTIWWKKPKNQLISFGTPDEMGLLETQRYLRDDPSATERLKSNYMMTLAYEVTPPTIKPVDVYWQFKDGSTQQSVWANSSQKQLTLPFNPTRTLQKIGMRSHDSTADIKWFDVAPSERWLNFGWEPLTDNTENNLGVLFEDLQLAIEPNCLAVDFGNGKACFRRR